MSRGPDAGVLLERALVAHAARAGIVIAIVEAGWERWASATFTGARHSLTIEAAESDALDAWLAGLPEAELPLRHALLADLSIVSVQRGDPASIGLEALTVDE